MPHVSRVREGFRVVGDGCTPGMCERSREVVRGSFFASNIAGTPRGGFGIFGCRPLNGTRFRAALFPALTRWAIDWCAYGTRENGAKALDPALIASGFNGETAFGLVRGLGRIDLRAISRERRGFGIFGCRPLKGTRFRAALFPALTRWAIDWRAYGTRENGAKALDPTLIASGFNGETAFGLVRGLGQINSLAISREDRERWWIRHPGYRPLKGTLYRAARSPALTRWAIDWRAYGTRGDGASLRTTAPRINRRRVRVVWATGFSGSRRARRTGASWGGVIARGPRARRRRYRCE